MIATIAAGMTKAIRQTDMYSIIILYLKEIIASSAFLTFKT